jgi:hypothetical protein
MNIEIDQETLNELEHAFKFNDAVLRHLIVAMEEAIVTPSPMMREEKSKPARDGDRGDRGDRGERGDRGDRGDRGERAPKPAAEAAPEAAPTATPTTTA